MGGADYAQNAQAVHDQAVALQAAYLAREAAEGCTSACVAGCSVPALEPATVMGTASEAGWWLGGICSSSASAVASAAVASDPALAPCSSSSNEFGLGSRSACQCRHVCCILQHAPLHLCYVCT